MICNLNSLPFVWVGENCRDQGNWVGKFGKKPFKIHFKFGGRLEAGNKIAHYLFSKVRPLGLAEQKKLFFAFKN